MGLYYMFEVDFMDMAVITVPLIVISVKILSSTSNTTSHIDTHAQKNIPNPLVSH